MASSGMDYGIVDGYLWKTAISELSHFLDKFCWRFIPMTTRKTLGGQGEGVVVSRNKLQRDPRWNYGLCTTELFFSYVYVSTHYNHQYWVRSHAYKLDSVQCLCDLHTYTYMYKDLLCNFLKGNDNKPIHHCLC